MLAHLKMALLKIRKKILFNTNTPLENTKKLPWEGIWPPRFGYFWHFDLVSQQHGQKFQIHFHQSKNSNQTTIFFQVKKHLMFCDLWSYRMVWPGTANKCYSPRYDWASSSKKEVVWMGMSCISQVQLPCGRLPGNGQVLPEIGGAIFRSILNIIIHYRWGIRAKHMPLSSLSTLGSLGCNSNLYTSLLCTDACYWCTI